MGQEPRDLLLIPVTPGGGWMEGSLSMSIPEPKLMNQGYDWKMAIPGERGGEAGMGMGKL